MRRVCVHMRIVIIASPIIQAAASEVPSQGSRTLQLGRYITVENERAVQAGRGSCRSLAEAPNYKNCVRREPRDHEPHVG